MKFSFNFVLSYHLVLGFFICLSGCKNPTNEKPASQAKVAEPAKPTKTICKHGVAKQNFHYSSCELTISPKTINNLNFYWWNKNQKKPYYTFNNLKKQLSNNHKQLKFAVNAGMYDDKYAPLALYVEKGHKIKALNLKSGKGNFHLMPNGVFWINQKNKAFITESNEFKATAKMVKFATQSGPMLVINGQIHPKFNPKSSSKKFRNGVGICQPFNQPSSKKQTTGNTQSLIFVNSDDLVNFYDFANLFKSELNCQNALFLDGGVASAMYSDDLDKNDGQYMGVMIGYHE